MSTQTKNMLGHEFVPNINGWRPKNGETYFYISVKVSEFGTEVVIEETSYESSFAPDWAMIEVGNCFQTEELALDAIVKPVSSEPMTDEEFNALSESDYVFTLGRHGDVLDVSKINYSSLTWRTIMKWRTSESCQKWIKENSK